MEKDRRLAVARLAEHEQRPLGRECDRLDLLGSEIDVDERRAARPVAIGSRGEAQELGIGGHAPDVADPRPSKEAAPFSQKK
jgi:hypothetical protein